MKFKSKNKKSTPVVPAADDQKKKPSASTNESSILSDEKIPEKSPKESAKKAKKVNRDVTEVSAKARFLRISPKKVRLVIDAVRGMKALEALDKLKFIDKKASLPVSKLIYSALANADHNWQLKKEDLYIKEIVANEGPTLHRWRARAFGRAAGINKRSTHLGLVLSVSAGKQAADEFAAKKEKANKE